MYEKKFSAFIVDDEEYCRLDVLDAIKERCPQLNVAGMAGSLQEARKFLADNSPDILFLDMELPGGLGIEITDMLHGRNIAVIVVTAHADYALRALKASAIDYLLKPVDPAELKLAVDKACADLLLKSANPEARKNYAGSLNQLINQVERKIPSSHLTLPHQQGFSMIALSDIVMLAASDNYTVIHLKNGEQQVASRTLSDLEHALDDTQFFRIHKSFIINLREMDRYNGSGEMMVKMKNGTEVPVARRRAPEFVTRAGSIGKKQ